MRYSSNSTGGEPVLYILRRAHEGSQPKTATCTINSQSVRIAENNNKTIELEIADALNDVRRI
jgi:hypothetical protein